MMNCNQLKELIIKPALIELLLYSDVAMELLVFTCANESDGGTFIKQVNGPALGIYQMEPGTYNDIWINYISNRQDINLQMIHNFDCNTIPPEDRLMYDIRFATAMCRIHYARVKEALPSIYDIEGIYNYYKKYYNTDAGKADYPQAMRKYQAFVGT